MQSLEDDGQYKNGWLIYTAKKSFSVYAATATEKQEWMAHIDKCIRDLLHKNGKKAATEHAAPWVPDTEANTCMVCNKSQFTLLNRRVRRYYSFFIQSWIMNRDDFYLQQLWFWPFFDWTNQKIKKCKFQKSMKNLETTYLF